MYNTLIKLGFSVIKSALYHTRYQLIELPETAMGLVKSVQIDTRKMSTVNAREARQKGSRADREIAIFMYQKLKEDDPTISKDKAALQLIKSKELCHIASVRTIRSYLPKG